MCVDRSKHNLFLNFNRASRRMGECKKLKACPPGKVFFPEKGECFDELSQGPCIRGKLLIVDESSIPKCMVGFETLLINFDFNYSFPLSHKRLISINF